MKKSATIWFSASFSYRLVLLFEGNFLMEKIQGLTFDLVFLNLAKASESRTYILPYVNLP